MTDRRTARSSRPAALPIALLAGFAITLGAAPVAVARAAAPSVGSASAAPSSVVAASTPIALVTQPSASGLDAPVFVTGDGSGTGWLYAVEQPGRIVAISPDGQVAMQPVLDIHDRVAYGGEQGLLGLALHPDFRHNGRLFIDYTRAQDGATVISELTMGDAGLVDPATERVILTIPQPFPNHNGGMLAFDREGMLLIGMGDGGGAGDPSGNGQNPASLLGKILRIDVDGETPYAIPADNPYLGTTTEHPEIRAFGVRNPWRYSVDRATGDLWIGDVGQNAWEEVDVIPAGAGPVNLGWNTMEGRACYAATPCDQADLQPPVAVVGHDAGACSVIGGYVYRGAAIPTLVGSYLFTDTCLGTLWRLDASAAIAAGTATPDVVGHADGAIVSFGEDDHGELLLVDHGGAILRLAAAAP